jgi:hypothetical protein
MPVRQVVRRNFRRAAAQLDRDPGYPGGQRGHGQPSVFPLGLAQQAAKIGQEGRHLVWHLINKPEVRKAS